MEGLPIAFVPIDLNDSKSTPLKPSEKKGGKKDEEGKKDEREKRTDSDSNKNREGSSDVVKKVKVPKKGTFI